MKNLRPIVNIKPKLALTLEYIYNIPDSGYNMINLYREVFNNPNAGIGISRNTLINHIVRQAKDTNRLSEIDYNTHLSKSMQFLLSISEDGINRLIQAYNIQTSKNDTKEKKALALYRRGVGYHDLLYAFINENSMVTGNIGYTPKVGEIIGNGVYDVSGKVDKNENDFIDVIVGNPFSHLSTMQLRTVASYWHVDIPTGKHQIYLIAVLSNFFEAQPDILNRIPFENVNTMVRPELYLKAGLNNIDISEISTRNMGIYELQSLVKTGTVIMNPISQSRPPNRNYKLYSSDRLLEYEEAYQQAVNGFILKSNNIGFRFNIFTHYKNRDETASYFAELSIYPPNVDANGYDIIRNSRSNILKSLLKSKYKTDDIMFLSDNHLVFIASRGYMIPDPNMDAVKARFNKLRTYSEALILKIRQIYNIPATETLFYDLAVEKVNPLEEVITSYYENTPRLTPSDRNKLAIKYGGKIGMIIPPTINDKDSYFWNNAPKYNKVMIRENITPFDKNLLSVELLNAEELATLLQTYTDQEIFGYTGVYTNYSSRDNLISKIEQIRRVPQFFIPTVRACSNADTITTLDSTIDPAVFIIGYGTIFEYYCYNLDDFDENFREFPVEGLLNVTSFRFRSPNEPNRDFTVGDIKALVPLLRLYANIEGVNQMIEHINTGITRSQDVTEYDRTLLQSFNLLNADKPFIRNWLYQLFTVGMYMRRWKGPPNPYPISRGDTQGPDPNDKVNTELQILGYPPLFQNANGSYSNIISGITEQLSANGRTFVDSLRSVEYVQDNVDTEIRVPRQETRTIGNYLDRVRKGNLCIRIASTSLVGTGAYYLRLLFNENIPNFDPTSLVQIA